MSTVFLGRRLDGRPVEVPLLTRTYGQYALGVTGQGKSTYLLGQICQDMVAGRGLALLDPAGDFVGDVIARANGLGRHKDILLLDLQAPGIAFGLNLFYCPDPNDLHQVSETAERVTGIFQKVWGDMSWIGRMGDLLGNCAHTLVENSGTTLADLPRLLTNDTYRQQLVDRLRNITVKEYWVAEYNLMSKAERRQVAGPLLNKVRAFLRDPLMRSIVSQKENSVDFGQAIRDRKIVLVRFASELEQATNLLGAAMIQQILEAAFARRNIPVADREPFMLYFDEAQRLVNPGFSRLLREARKYGIATTAATQIHAEMPHAVARAFENAAIIVCFQLIPDDAKQLASFFTGEGLQTTKTIYESDPHGRVLRGHDDPQMVQTARRVEQLLANYQSERERYVRELRQFEQDAPLVTSHIRELRILIDSYLYEGMRLGNFATAYDQLERFVFGSGRGYFATSYQLLEACKRFAGQLSNQPLTLKATKERNNIQETLLRLPKGHALVRWDDGKQKREAIIKTLLTRPLKRPLLVTPLGIPISHVALDPEAETASPTPELLLPPAIFFDQPPPAFEAI
jgi:hypothetical protein